MPKFEPRGYQLPVFKAFEKDNYKRGVCTWSRRAGKDLTAFHLMLRAAMRKVGVYYYLTPTYSQGKKILWDSITNEGIKFLDYIPKELVVSMNSSELKIILINNSLIQIVGSTDYDRLMGTNPQGCVFSEYAMQTPEAWKFLKPILAANDGWALFISTPRGKNHFYKLWQTALNNPDDWFSLKLTVEDTKHIPLTEIQKERDTGEMSEDLIQQEYYCSFSMGVEGSYYSKYINTMKREGRIGNVKWDSSLSVNTAWDLGIRDNTCIVFFQQAKDKTIRIIDSYEGNKQGLAHYIKLVLSKPYVYKKHIAPHDIRVQELGTGNTRLNIASQLGINFTVADNIPIMDGIESVRAKFPQIYIDEENCGSLIKSLESYRQEYDSKKQIYKKKPLHDWASHWADCMRYLCISLDKICDGLSNEQREKNYQEAMFGKNTNLPEFFR